jgi:hypothetical protein
MSGHTTASGRSNSSEGRGRATTFRIWSGGCQPPDSDCIFIAISSRTASTLNKDQRNPSSVPKSICRRAPALTDSATAFIWEATPGDALFGYSLRMPPVSPSALSFVNAPKCHRLPASARLQPRLAMTSRYSPSTLVVPSRLLLFSDHSWTSSLRSCLCPFKSREAKARDIGP